MILASSPGKDTVDAIFCFLPLDHMPGYWWPSKLNGIAGGFHQRWLQRFKNCYQPSKEVQTTQDADRGSRFDPLAIACFIMGHCEIRAFDLPWHIYELLVYSWCGDDFSWGRVLLKCRALCHKGRVLLRKMDPQRAGSVWRMASLYSTQIGQFL